MQPLFLLVFGCNFQLGSGTESNFNQPVQMEKYLGVSGDTDGLTTNAAGEQAGIEYWKIAKPLVFFLNWQRKWTSGGVGKTAPEGSKTSAICCYFSTNTLTGNTCTNVQRDQQKRQLQHLFRTKVGFHKLWSVGCFAFLITVQVVYMYCSRSDCLFLDG